MDDDDECPDSTVLLDDDDLDEEDPDVMVSFPLHRRSFDEPQSSRISSTQYSSAAFSTLPQLPPLPKLIFRPPAHAGHFPSVSFSSTQQQGGMRVGSNSSSRGEGSSHSLAFSTSRSESFPGTRGGLGSSSGGRGGDATLPRLESRSELTISRVSSTPPVRAKSRGGVSSSSGSRGEIPGRVGISISRVGTPSTSFARIGSGSSSSQRKIPEIPQLTRIGSSSQQSDNSPSRKFGRRFLKSAPTAAAKPQPPNVARLPMPVIRTSSTEEYFTQSASQSHLSAEDVNNESAMDFPSSSSGRGGGRQRLSYPATSSSSGRRVPTETLTSQQGLQGIKLHIRTKPVEVIEVDDSSSERSSNSLSSTAQNNSDSNIGMNYDFSSPPSISVSANSSSGLSTDEVSVKPVSLKAPFQERLKIPADLIIDEAEVDEEDDGRNALLIQDMEMQGPGGLSPPPPFLQQLMMGAGRKKRGMNKVEGTTRRTTRKRQTPVPTPEVAPKVRRRRGGGAPLPQIPAIGQHLMSGGILNTATPPPPIIELPATPGARGRGTGRGRGRPRGSTNKARLLREQELQKAQGLPTPMEIEILELDAKPEVLLTPEDNVKSEESPVTAADTTCPEVGTPLLLTGDPEVNSEVSSASTPTKKPRGRGRGSPRGGTGTPRTSRASRGTRGTRRPRGEKKTPEEKKAKQEKKEAIKAPPPVQVFEEETRMSADIKPPIPDRVTALSTPVVVDEESRTSNVSSTSTSTTAKAKRFTKDPIEERKPVTAATLFEYQWPLNDKNAEFYFLQEQISEYLGVKSFKRKYPDIRRRIVDMEERDFLRDSKVVSETQCDLGLTAIHSLDVLDIMFNDFTEKYEEYRKIYQERKEQEMSKLRPQQLSEADTPAVRDRSAEFMRRILKSCAKWNFSNNRERIQERSCAFDLQTGTLHFQKEKLKVLSAERTKLGKYPVAVLPGQFTDDYKQYTADELYYLPLNSVRYGPISENWIVDSDSSDESSDSEDSSSSDESSSSSSEEEEGSVDDANYITLMDEGGNVMYRGRLGLTKVSTDAKCKSCDGTAFRNKDGNPEVLLHCSRCDVPNHPTCLELTVDMLPFITKYHWECTDCKNCIECNDPADEDKMLFCDCCDRGYHIYCVGLRKVPTGRWHCSVCSLCYSCGATQPSPEDRMAEWHHEFRKGEKGAKFYLHSFCVACHKLFKKGQFCPSCLKVHAKIDKENKKLLECRKCEKWVHRECVKRPLKSMFGFMCDPCDANFRSRSKLPSHVN